MNNNYNNYSKLSIYSCYYTIKNIKYEEYINLTEEQKTNIKTKLNKYMTTLINDYNKSFDYINHENLKNCYMSLEEEHKLIALREKQYLNSEKIFRRIYDLYKLYRSYIKDTTILKELFITIYNITLKQSYLTTELYKIYYLRLNTIYFKEEIPYNYKTIADFFLILTENNNALPLYILMTDYEKYKIQYNIDYEPLIKNIEIDIDIRKTEQEEYKENLDFYQDNKSYFLAHEILEMTNEYDKLPIKLKTIYKHLAHLHNTKPLYEKNYFLNNLLNKEYFFLTEKNIKKHKNTINELYNLNQDFLNVYLMYKQDPSIYEPKPKISKLDKLLNVSYCHKFNYEEEDRYLLLGH